MLDISPLDGIRSPFGQRRGGGPAPAFSPSTLYSSGSQGIWLDPSDLSTMFSDRAGTTAVTTPGTVVGLRLDKSKGLALGAELVTNGTFDSGTTGWTSWQTGTLSVDTGRLKVENGAATISGGYQLVTVVVGKVYQFEGVKEAGTASGPRYYLGTSVGGTQYSSNAAASTKFTATSTTLVVTASTQTTTLGATAFFDNISIRELAGNHAQAPTDAARPTYGLEPKGGRRNLLTWSEGFDNAVWAKPRATATATKISSSATTTQVFLQATQGLTKAASSLTYTFSVELKEAELRYAGVAIQDATAANGIFSHTDTRDAANLNQGAFGTGFTLGSVSRTLLGDGYVRVVVTGTTDTGTTIAAGVQPSKNSTFSSTSYVLGDGMLVRNAQLELGSTASAYQRVLSAYDVTESGVATTHYVQYDGSDDSMSTAAIDFTATDKMSVFAGVRKLSDAASGVVVESGTDVSLVGGSFLLAHPRSGSVNAPSFLSRGTSTSAAISSSNAYPAPRSSVITGTSDISGDLTTLRENGTSLGQSTADQGTGNYGNYPLYIGRRNNATLPFNGRDFGIIVVGKAASSTEISDTETWLAAKTSGVSI